MSSEQWSPQRRFPRIAHDLPGEIAPPGDAEPIPVTIRCLACEGAGLSLSPDAPLRPGAAVTLRFALSEERVELAARVVWAAGGRAGLRLRLGASAPEAKRAYGAWIVPRTKQALAAAAARQ
jgi:hypothetical protein